MKLTVIAALIAVAVPATVSADILYPEALTFETGYASGPPAGFPLWSNPEPGDPLVIVGRVSAVAAPFDAMLPPGGTYEITYVYEGSTCTTWGMWDNIPCSGGIFGFFEGGTLAIYLDTSPDADFTNPMTFRDGTLALLATTTLINVSDDDPQEVCPMVPDQPDVTAPLVFTGGTWFPLASYAGQGCAGFSRGELEMDVPGPLASLGYIFNVDGRVDVTCPVAAEARTWGAVKSMYR